MKLSLITEGPKDVESLSKRFIGWKVYFKNSGKFVAISINNANGESLGNVLLMRTLKDYFTVANIEAVGGQYRSNKWGPLLYDIVIEYSTMFGNGLIPADAFSMYEREKINFNNKNSEELDISSLDYYAKSGREDLLDKDLLNFTNENSKKMYKRLFNIRKGLYGKSIKVEPINRNELVKAIGPSFHPTYAFNGELRGMPYNWIKHKEWVDKIDSLGGKYDSEGRSWPIFISHTERFIDENEYLFAIYKKEPYIIHKLQERDLISGMQ